MAAARAGWVRPCVSEWTALQTAHQDHDHDLVSCLGTLDMLFSGA